VGGATWSRNARIVKIPSAPRCAEQMTGRRFGGTHGNFSVAAEHGFDRFQFGNVTDWRRSGMSVEMLDISGLEAGLP
jgi:hypothetical protein